MMRFFKIVLNITVLNQVFIIPKTVWIFAINLVALECVKSMLVSSANKAGIDLLYTNLGKSFIYRRNSNYIST